jgi:hypothetical protein
MEQIAQAQMKSVESSWATKWDRGWQLVTVILVLTESFYIGVRREIAFVNNGSTSLAAYLPVIWFAGASTCCTIWQQQRRGNLNRRLAMGVITQIALGLMLTCMAFTEMVPR